MRWTVLALLAACNHGDPFTPVDASIGCKPVELRPIAVPVGKHPMAMIGATRIDGASTNSLVVADRDSNTVHIIRRASASYEFAATTLQTGLQPVAVAALDVDGDAKSDIVVANSGDNTISIFHNRGWGSDEMFAGVATFDPPVVIPVGHRPSAIALVGPNLAIANGGDNTISILVNDGHGAFTAGGTVAVGANPVAVVAATVVALDSHTDLVVANRDANTITLLQNSGNDRTFTAKQTLATGAAPSAIATDVQTGGVPSDIWVANEGSDDVTFFSNNGTDQYTAGVVMPVGGSPRGILHNANGTFVADYDDGVILDLENGMSHAIGLHPTGLFVGALASLDAFAAPNEDVGIVTIEGRDCAF